MVICGYISDPAPGGSHAWNIARIDGRYYQFDSTWDEATPPAFYRYFAVSDEEIASLRRQNIEEFSQQIAPECPASLFPEMKFDIAETLANEKTYTALLYYTELNAKATEPERLLYLYGFDLDEITQIEEKDGSVTTDVPYDYLEQMLSVLLEDAERERFLSDGTYTDKNGALSYRRPDPRPVGWRICELTEETDGSVTAVAYRIDHLGAMQRVEQNFRFSGRRIRSITDR